MKIALGAAASAAWRLFRRDRQVLIALAGMFLFLPRLAVQLLVPPAPLLPDANAPQDVIELWAQDYIGWTLQHAPLLVGSLIMSLFGSLAITLFYVGPQKPDVAGSMRLALRLAPGWLGVMTLVSFGASIGFFAFILPGLWLLGRAMLTGPDYATRQDSAWAALSRSFARTRGNGLLLAGVAGLGVFGGQLLATPFLAVDNALRKGQAENPVALVLADSGVALVTTAAALALVLLRITLYWTATSDRSQTPD